jgi:uncharacterized protein (TIGR03790 family)
MPSIKKRLILSLGIALCSFSLVHPGQGQSGVTRPESVVVVANGAMDGSVRVARHYMKRRHIPEANLILLETPEREKIPRELYLEAIHNPILDTLMEKGLVDGIGSGPDDHGRKQVTLLANKVRYMVLCYGIPSKVIGPSVAGANDAHLIEQHFKGNFSHLVQAFTEGQMARTEASIDGELAVLLLKDIPLRGFWPNPYYKDTTGSKGRDVIRVTRLDGPSPQAVIRMIDNAIAGEENGLKGRAYVDEDARGGNYAIGNQWMSQTAALFKALGYDLSHDTKRSTFQPADRFDAPVLYAGWYAPHRNGPFLAEGWQFPEGAVAAHLHSYSANIIRSSSKGWVGPMVDKGVSATFGNVAEPFLTLTHQFDAFFYALANGWNFGDAAYFALPGLSWQAVSIGDPLFRPFSVSHEMMLKDVGDPLRILEDQYVILRQIRLLEQQGKADEALALADRGMRETPGPALALERSRLHKAAGNKKTARNALSLFKQMPPSSASDWGLYADIADELLALGDAKGALRIYQGLEKQARPEKVQLAFLKRGIKSAKEAGEPGIAIDWQARVTPPPPPPKPPPEAGADKPKQPNS